MLPRAMTGEKAGPTNFTTKHNRELNGTALHHQRRRMPEPYPWLEKLQEQRDAYWLISCPEGKLSMQFAIFRHSRNCNMHFMTSTQSKDTTFS
jgi:hypothetical protein